MPKRKPLAFVDGRRCVAVCRACPWKIQGVAADAAGTLSGLEMDVIH